MLPFNVWAQSLWETLYMVILSTAISYLIGLPLGLTLVVTDKNADGGELPELDGKLLYSDSSAAWFQLDNNMSSMYAAKRRAA